MFNKEKALSFYVKTNQPEVYKSASIVWDNILAGFKSIPCPCCGSLPTKVDPLLVASGVGTTRVECGKSYLPVSENLNYTTAQRILEVFPRHFKNLADAQNYVNKPQALGNRVYANRMGNGDEASGDGFKYSGKGYPNLTGKEMYFEISKILGIDLVANPNLALDPVISGKIMAAFLIHSGAIQYCLTKDWDMVRLKVNGGTNGLQLFKDVMNAFIN